MIEIQNITKRFHALTALDDVSMEIPRGEVLGLLGPNGAGKTTLFKILAGILYPDSGGIRPLGSSWPAIGYKPERLLFPNRLRIGDYLELVAGLCDLPASQKRLAVEESLHWADLTDSVGKRIKDCSKGMRQRIGLAQALIGDPPLLLLDEPSNGLDPEGQADIHHRIEKLHEAGKTIVLSSHQLQEVTDVCTGLVILNHGRIHYQNSMANALATRSHTAVQAERDLTPMRESLMALHPDLSVDGDTVILREGAMSMRRQVLLMLLNHGYDVICLERKRVTLAEIYAEAVR